MIKAFEDYLLKLKDDDVRRTTTELLHWITEKYPTLEPVFKWSQPMFTLNGTFIIGFHASKNHLSIAPENQVLIHFKDLFKKNDLEVTIKIVKMKWKDGLNYSVLEEIIEFNMIEKKDCKTFWSLT